VDASKKNKLTIYCLSLFLVFFIINNDVMASDIQYTGTFSSIEYNQEGGDLLGVEIRIVYTRNGYQSTLQIAEGGVSELIIVKPLIENNRIKFTIHEPKLYEGVFIGIINSKKIKGVLKYKDGGELEINIPRKKSYWD
jgi:hypothetical protein